MKTILAYGDSLTYGSSPIPGGPRHAYEDRWPSALEAGLGGAARVIAEGLGGRTTIFDDWGADADRNGARILPTILSSHSPLDMIIFMLGTNDLKHYLGGTALEAANGMRRLVEITRGHYLQKGEAVPEIILVCPPQLTDTDHPDLIRHFGQMKAMIESKEMPRWYKTRADELGVGFFDASRVAKPDSRDGVHLDASNTRAIGEGLVPLVKRILGL